MIAKESDEFDGDDVDLECSGCLFEALPPISIDPVTGCWIPKKRSRTEKGYVRVMVGGRWVRLHRFIFALVNGRLRPDELVRHSCDVRDCCNPAHLLKGTIADNNADREARGRGAKGERIGTAKLTNAKAIEIVQDMTLTPVEKAVKNGVSKRAVYDVLAGKSYRDVTAPYRNASSMPTLPTAPR